MLFIVDDDGNITIGDFVTEQDIKNLKDRVKFLTDEIRDCDKIIDELEEENENLVLASNMHITYNKVMKEDNARLIKANEELEYKLILKQSTIENISDTFYNYINNG